MRRLLVLVSSALVACGSPESDAVDDGLPAGWDADVRLRDAVDRNPDPGVVEVDLTAKIAPVTILPGVGTEAWTYDGGIPGPTIRAKAGDRVVVHFRNELAEATTIHWHGLRIPAAMDGAPGFSQPEIPPGGTFDYDFVVPDAGLFWYHPHVHSAAQVGYGLYGAFMVEPAEPEPDLGDELVLVLSDIGLDDAGQLQPADASGDTATLFGREGKHLLVNGKKVPTLLARSGRPQRWRVVNAAKSRYYQIALAGHRFTRVGGDGGLITEPEEIERPVLAPGERADLRVVPRGAPGSELGLRWIPFDRGYGSTEFRSEEDLLALRFAEGAEAETPAMPAIARAIEPIATAGATDVTLALTQNDVNGKMALGINGVPSWEAEPLTAMVGETQVWTIQNTIAWAHPFHLHGFFFQVLDESGQPHAPLEWKDTVNVPVDGTVRFAVRYDDRPGMWMFHCHVLDHADAGMMGMLMLE